MIATTMRSSMSVKPRGPVDRKVRGGVRSMMLQLNQIGPGWIKPDARGAGRPVTVGYGPCGAMPTRKLLTTTRKSVVPATMGTLIENARPSPRPIFAST